MIRLATVLSVCLTVHFGAATAPFVHAHETNPADRAGAPIVHRHLTPHDASGGHHDDDDHDDSTAAEGQLGLGLTPSATAVSAAVGVMSVNARARVTVKAPVAPIVATPAPSPGAVAPDEDVGHRLASSPGPSSSILRGPPR